MKKLVIHLSPVIFIFALACGGGDSPPPPIASNPQTTPAIQCAVARLDDAANKCKSSILPLIPLLLQNNNNSSGGNNNDSTAALLTALAQKKSSPAPAAPVAPPQPGCPTPQVDNQTSCNDDMTTAILLAKSAQKQDGSLAINDPFYRLTFMLKIKNFLNQTSQQLGLNPDQQAKLKDSLSQAFLSSDVLGRSGLNSSQSGGIASLLQQGTNGGDLSSLLGSNNFKLFHHTKPPSVDVTKLGLKDPGHGITYNDNAPIQHRDATPDNTQSISLDQLKQAAGVGLPRSAAFNLNK